MFEFISRMGVVVVLVLSTACSAGGDANEGLPVQTAAGGGGTSNGAGGLSNPGGSTGSGGTTGGVSGGSMTGGASSGGTGGATSAIFDWPEADTVSGPCLPGRYLGTFRCLFNDPTNPLIPKDLEVTGPVAFNLTESTRGEFLEIADGTIDGAALVFVQFAGPLEGELDCGSKKFAAQVVNGSSFAGPFTGDMQGALDPNTQTLAGQWTLKATSLPDGACVGTWTVVRQP